MENATRAPLVPSDARARLRNGRVLVVGVGGLGFPAALQLATAGVGTIGLIDGDTVEISNLQRQIIYRGADVGHPKVAAAARRLREVNENVAIHAFDEPLTASNLPGVFAGFDFVIDGTDRIESKFLLNDGAVVHGLPFSHAGIIGFQGQTFTILPRRTACLRCLFPTPPTEEDAPTCQTAGVLGALAGTIGLIQAAEALKFLLGNGELLTNRLLTGDAWRQHWRRIEIAANPRCPVCR